MNPVFLVLIASVGFATWPLIARFSGANTMWVNLLLVSSTTIFISTWYSREIVNVPSWRVVGLLVIAGAFNTIGTLAYCDLIARPAAEISKYIPAALILTVILSTVGGIVFYNESMTWQKLLGATLGVITVWLLTYAPSN